MYILFKYLLLFSLKYFIAFTKILDCSLIPAEELSRLNVKVSNVSEVTGNSTLIIEYICEENYTMLHEGDFVYECQGNGTWNNSNVPQCVNRWLFYF